MTEQEVTAPWNWSRHAAKIGRIRSEARARASRANGLLGGRRPQGVTADLWHAARAKAMAQGLDYPAMIHHVYDAYVERDRSAEAQPMMAQVMARLKAYHIHRMPHRKIMGRAMGRRIVACARVDGIPMAELPGMVFQAFVDGRP